MTTINKDTKIYGSLSQQAGSKGCEFFNAAFQKYGINAIYKSFSVTDIAKALEAVKYLGFSGCAVSMPFKTQAFELMDLLSIEAVETKNINTVLVKEGKLVGYNTDFIAAFELINWYNPGVKTLYILGNGGLASSVRVAASKLGLDTITITRTEWELLPKLKNSFIFNCTPVSLTLDESNTYVDCLVGTKTGNELHFFQAKNQFKIYTGKEYE